MRANEASQIFNIVVLLMVAIINETSTESASRVADVPSRVEC